LVETPAYAEDGNNDGRANTFVVHEPASLENEASNQTGDSIESYRYATRHLEDGNVMLGERDKDD